MPQFVDDETAVGVAVEGQPDVGAGRRRHVPAGRRGSPGPAGWPRGWESAVEFEVQRQQRDRRDRSQHRRAWCDRPSRCRRRRRPAAAARPTGRPASAGIRRSRPARRGRPILPTGPSYPGTPGDHVVTDRRQPGVLADGLGTGAAQLDAVVGRRVVAGGEHRAGAVQQTRRRSTADRSRQARSGRRRGPGPPRRRRTRRPATASWPACRDRSRPARHRCRPSSRISRANAPPTSATNCSSISSPTRPRTSYALMTRWTAAAGRDIDLLAKRTTWRQPIGSRSRRRSNQMGRATPAGGRAGGRLPRAGGRAAPSARRRGHR